MDSSRRAILALCVGLSGLAVSGSADAPSSPPVEDIQRSLTALAENNPALAEQVAAATARSEQDGAWRAWLVAAAARQQMGRHDEAAQAYREFLAMCQDPTERAFAVGRLRDCASAGAEVPAPARLTADQQKRLGEVHDQTVTESSEHFVVRAANAELAKLVAARAETDLGRICQSILSGQAYPHSVDIYIWPDAAEYRKHAARAPEWAGGAFSYRPGRNGDVIRRIDLTQRDAKGRFDAAVLDRVLPHEMCHLVLAEFFGGGGAPLALGEGLAMMAEAGVDNSRVLLAGAALLSDKRISLPELMRLEACRDVDADVFYAESYSLTSYIHARMTGRQFRDMLGHIKAGLPLDEALQRALYVGPDESFLGHLSRAWEAEAVRQSQFLHALGARMDGTS